jgi:hypothetical protein
MLVYRGANVISFFVKSRTELSFIHLKRPSGEIRWYSIKTIDYNHGMKNITKNVKKMQCVACKTYFAN